MSNDNNGVQQQQPPPLNVQAINYPKLEAPKYMPDNVEGWFYLLESYFSASGIRVDQVKFDTVRSRFPATRINELRPLAEAADRDAPANGKYEMLKTSLISYLQDSQQRRLRQVLQEMPLGDKKPSQLYHDMVHAAGSALSESALLDLWCSRLPEWVASTAIAASGPTADKLRMADISYENFQLRSGSAVNAVGSAHKQPPTANMLALSQSSTSDTAALRQMLDEFTKMFMAQKQTAQAAPSQRSRSRERSQARQQSKQRSDSSQGDQRRDESIEQFDDCWYHRTFGRKATKCRQPCKFRRDHTPAPQHNLM